MPKTFTFCFLAAIATTACGDAGGDRDATSISNTGSMRMPLVAQSSAGKTYRLNPARFRVTGPGINQVVDASGIDVLNIDLAQGDHLVQLLTGWQLLLVNDDNTTTPAEAALQSENPVGFTIQEQQISEVVFRFGVGPDAIAFGFGRGRVKIEVNDGCQMFDWFQDADGDGFGGPNLVQACQQPAGAYVANSDDCDDTSPLTHPGGFEVCDGIDTNCDGQVDGAALCKRRVFVTSTIVTANFGGLFGADAECQQRAQAGGLGGTWIAWLSDGATAARDRLNASAGPFVRLDQAVVANDLADLTDGSVANPINLTEIGSTTSTQVFTGTRPDGTTTGFNCQGWTTASGLASGTRGSPASTNGNWTQITTDACNATQGFYCFEL